VQLGSPLQASDKGLLALLHCSKEVCQALQLVQLRVTSLAQLLQPLQQRSSLQRSQKDRLKLTTARQNPKQALNVGSHHRVMQRI
jgi:hypothetical protein